MIAPLPVPAVFSPDECAALVRLAEGAGFEAAGLVRGRSDAGQRRSGAAWLDETGEAEWAFARIVETVVEANRAHFRFELSDFAERAQIARYDAAEGGHFDWHVDSGGGALASRRKLTLVVQLSDAPDYEGGRLELNADGRPSAVDRRIGAGVLFPCFTLHRVSPVTRGRRYSLTTWVHGPDFV